MKPPATSLSTKAKALVSQKSGQGVPRKMPLSPPAMCSEACCSTWPITIGHTVAIVLIAVSTLDAAERQSREVNLGPAHSPRCRKLALSKELYGGVEETSQHSRLPDQELQGEVGKLSQVPKAGSSPGTVELAGDDGGGIHGSNE